MDDNHEGSFDGGDNDDLGGDYLVEGFEVSPRSPCSGEGGEMTAVRIFVVVGFVASILAGMIATIQGNYAEAAACGVYALINQNWLINWRTP